MFPLPGEERLPFRGDRQAVLRGHKVYATKGIGACRKRPVSGYGVKPHQWILDTLLALFPVWSGRPSIFCDLNPLLYL